MTPELRAHILADNAKTREWIAAAPGRGAGLHPCPDVDAEYYEEMGLHTLEDFERYHLLSYISDGYKDAHGFRPRHLNTDDMDLDELKALADDISEDVKAEIEREEAIQKEAVTSFEALINTTIEAGAGDRPTALRWLREADDDDYMKYDDDYFRYEHGLPYSYDFANGVA